MAEAVERREPIDSTASVIQNHNAPQFEAEDLALERLRVVGKDAKLVELNVAKPGDLAVGADAEDEGSSVYPAPGELRFYIITWRTNYACGFGEQQGQWEAGDPAMPQCAKKQYHYTLYVPQHDAIMPVMFTANGTTAKTMRRINTQVARAGIEQPYIQAWKLTTKIFSGAKGSWPGAVVTLTESVDNELKVAKGLYDSMVGISQSQLGSGSTPTF